MKLSAKVVIPIIAVVVIGIGAAVYFSGAGEDKGRDNSRIPYQEGVVVLEDTTIEPTEDGWIDLTYSYRAFSHDGINFSCNLTNDASNQYDLYFDIYADTALKDEIYLSGLLPPGTALRNVELKHALPVGTNDVYVVFTQVDTEQAIVGQATVTVEFIVLE